MSWNYRIIRHFEEGHQEEFFDIHEVYYDEKGNPKAVSQDGVSIHGSTVEDLKKDLGYHAEALDKPILDYSSFVDETDTEVSE